MAKNLRDLSISLKKLNSKIERFSESIVKDVSARILKDLAFLTPVDTSLAISNWQVSIGSYSSSTVPHYFKGKSGSTFQASYSQAYSVGYSIISQFKNGRIVYIYNNLDYIEDLEKGYSDQREYFVRDTLLKARSYVSSYADRLRLDL